ncbi:hypothetical protein TWF481_002312 [Arthrobotrys musiformis]|uniref:peptidylprolyl isomerase n=1 Tax=Arthrobotrys musiformis TaxID=47236 RepID=A0AAV9VSS9_9PEZI
MEELGILSFVVDGVLDLYALTMKLKNLPTTSVSELDRGGESENGIGINNIFSFKPHWQIHPQQTTRGISAFLSSFRVFAHRISSRVMTASQQENVLRVIYGLTRFFPILKAFRTLMGGESISPAQSALSVQCFYQLLKEVISTKALGGNQSRLLEGSRLLFGYILEMSRLIDESTNIPLQDAFKTVDLSDITTSSLVKDPVFIDMRLVDASSLASLPLAEVMPLPENIRRVFKLTRTTSSEYSYFDVSEVQDAYRHYSKIEINPKMARDLHYLSGICEACTCSFVVTLPADLAKASAPCLTFDSEGNIAVYTGRTPCAKPGKDFQTFLPLLGKEITVDIAAVTSLLNIILEAREAGNNPSLLFDAVGIAVNRKKNDPKELLMFVVDCSQSMEGTSEFYSVDEDSGGESCKPSMEEPDFDCLLESAGGVPAQWVAVRALKNHESFEDMVAIVRAVPKIKRLRVAMNALKYLSELSKREIVHLMGPSGSETFHESKVSGELSKAVSKLQILSSYASRLPEVLVTETSRGSTAKPLEWVWKTGSECPSDDSRDAPGVTHVKVPVSQIPDTLMCPITKELFQDPVVAADGHTYERRAIERWFSMTTEKKSPSTGSEIAHTKLVADVPTTREIEEWTNANDVIGPIGPNTPYPLCDINFEVPGIAPFTRTIEYPPKLTDLYHIVYRGSKGRQRNFKLILDGRPIAVFEECPNQESRTIPIDYIDYEALEPTDETYDQVYDDKTIVVEVVSPGKNPQYTPHGKE